MSAEIVTAISPELLVLLPVLYIIAEIIKKTNIKNWCIPFILWGISLVLVISYLLITKPLLEGVCLGIVQGTLLAMATVGGNQFYKQATEKRLTDTSATNTDTETETDETQK